MGHDEPEVSLLLSLLLGMVHSDITLQPQSACSVASMIPCLHHSAEVKKCYDSFETLTIAKSSASEKLQETVAPSTQALQRSTACSNGSMSFSMQRFADGGGSPMSSQCQHAPASQNVSECLSRMFQRERHS